MQYERQKETQYRGFLLMFYWLGLMAVLTLLVAATYTWFSLSKTPRVSDMNVHITSPAGLQIALRYDSPEEEWGQAVDFADMVPVGSNLKPCTWSDKDQQLYAVVYGSDGRMTDDWQPLTDERNANREDSEGYYTLGTFYARSDAAVAVSLSEAITLEDGTQSVGTYLIGTPVWNEQMILHQNGGSGAEYAMRVGIRVTPVDREGTPSGDSTFYIFEPNCDGHVEGGAGYMDTPSIDGTESLVPEGRLITQTTSSWTEAYPVQRTVTLREMGDFTSPKELFTLGAGGMARLDLYLWLEGQDVDCTNKIGDAAQILASIQFAADYSGQSGMITID